MKQIIALSARDIKLFLRDKTTLFMSFLSALILLALFFLFLGRTYVTNLIDGSDGLITSKQAYFTVYLQLIGGLLAINCMSVALGAFITLARDFEKRRIDCLLLTPARPYKIMLAYFIAGFTASFFINLILWVLSAVLISVISGYLLSVGAFFATVGILALSAVIASAVTLLITVLIKSSTALGVLGGVSGTVFGFLCGIYMPYSMLGKGTEYIGSVLPFTHLGIAFKGVLLSDAFRTLNIPNESADYILRTFSANEIGIFGAGVPLWACLIIMSFIAAVCFSVAWVLLKKRTVKGERKRETKTNPANGRTV